MYIQKDKRIIVVGSLNANPADRVLSRQQIKTMQYIDSSENVQPIPFFNNWGELGMSSIAYHPDNIFNLYLASSSEVFEFDLQAGKFINLQIPNLTDIHEISMIGNGLWISNTKHDEIVCFNIKTRTIEQRINLTDFKSTAPEDDEDGDDVEVVDKFHCNLVFEGFDGDTYILVHHTSGRQLMKRIAQKFIKSQGNGGVVNISQRKRYPLNFKAPHSVRRVGNNYWVFDSGHFELKVFDKNWKFLRSMNTKGFGRGADFDPDVNYFYAGVSETRKRYLGLFPGGDAVPNMVQIISTENYQIVKSILIENVEQINNVYCFHKDVADALLDFKV